MCPLIVLLDASSLARPYHGYHRMDSATVALLEGLDPTESGTYTTLSKSSKIPYTTLWHRAHGRPSIQDKAKSQQYLTPSEEEALVKYVAND
jgi:hypothetical protein